MGSVITLLFILGVGAADTAGTGSAAYTYGVPVCPASAADTSSLTADDTAITDYIRFEDPAPLSCLVTWFPGILIRNGFELKSFIRSSGFHRFRERFGDRRAADAIYVRAMNLTNDNTAVALFLSMIACFDHRFLGFRIPVFLLVFPLTDESSDEFEQRVRNLPARLYADTPPDSAGDRDKLQHFFGSAFLTYISESRGSADRVGEFIEEGEEAIVVGGVNDVRDMRANRQGQRFGMALFGNNRQYPSRFLVPAPAAGKAE